MTAEPRSAAASPMMIALIVAVSFFMEVLDGTVLTTAVPEMAKSFAVAPVSLGLGITSYMLVMAVFTPTSSWISDRFGTRTVFLAALGIFTVASLLCAASQTLEQFVAARALQGLGGAFMSSVGRIVQLRVTAKSELVRMVTIATAPGLVATVLGPPVGGFITTYFSWEWIFLLNLPVGVLGIAMVLRYFPDLKEAPRPFDAGGFFLNGVALGLLLYGLSAIAETQAWEIPLALTVAGVVLAYVAIRHARVHPHPLIPLSAAAIPTFRVTSITAGLFLRFPASAIPFVFPLLFQVGFGMSAFLSGLLFLGHAAGDLGLKAVTARVMRTFGFRRVLIFNTWALVLSLVACAWFTPTTPDWIILGLLFLAGGFRSLLYTVLSTLAYADVPPKDIGDASVLGNVTFQLVRAFGISVSAILINLSVAARGAAFGATVPADFKVAIIATALITAVGLFWWYRLPADIGAEVSGHRARLAPRPG